MFLLELLVQVILPLVFLSMPKVRQNPSKLFWSAALVVVGTVLNRINVVLIGPRVPTGAAYFPNWIEFSVTIGLISGGLILFMLAARYLPIFEAEAEAH